MSNVVPFLPAQPREQWLTKRQAAEHLAVTTRTIERWQRDHGLPYSRVGTRCRYRASELDEWATRSTASPPTS